MKKWGIPLIVCFLATGCAFTKANLDIGYDPAKAERGPLSSVETLKISISELKDSRTDKEVIGHKVNGIGMETADIVTKKPVPEIMRSALMTMFEKNGHLLKEANGQVTLDGEIKEFWLELQMNMMTVEFLGTMTLNLNVKDSNRNVLYAHEYQGHYDEKKAAGYVKSWENVMNITLQKLMYQIATDQELVKVLSARVPQSLKPIDSVSLAASSTVEL
jgi:uncharacterized lipoprotein YajG